jgi:hypothetical protein
MDMIQNGTITMAMRELDRLKVIQAVIDGILKPSRAAERLGLTDRQVRRFVKSDALAIIEADNVVDDVGFGLSVAGILGLSDALHFEVQEEAFSDSIVPATSFAAYATG